MRGLICKKKCMSQNWFQKALLTPWLMYVGSGLMVKSTGPLDITAK